MNAMVSLKKQKICGDASAAHLFYAMLLCEDEVGQNKEHFWAMGLNTKNVVQYVELVTLGTLDASLVHPREVFRRAVMHGVASVIVGHNHPSGDTTPSDQDRSVTKRLKAAGDTLGIELLDHLIIGRDEAEHGFHGMRSTTTIW